MVRYLLLFTILFCHNLVCEQGLTGIFRYRDGHLHRSKSVGVGTYSGRTKLRWDDVRMYTLALEWKAKWWKHGYCRFEGELGAVGHATITHRDFFYKDYLLSDEADLYDEIRYGSNNGYFAAFKGAVGWNWCLSRWGLSFTPVLGGSFRQLHLCMDRGKITFFGESDLYRLKSFPKHTRTRNHWSGLFIGLDATWDPCSWMHLAGKAEVHLPVFIERGCWQLRDYRFMSPAVGPGYLLELNVLFPVQKQCDVGLQFGWEEWRMFGLPEEYTFPDGEKSYCSKLYHHFFRNVYIGLTCKKIF